MKMNFMCHYANTGCSAARSWSETKSFIDVSNHIIYKFSCIICNNWLCQDTNFSSLKHHVANINEWAHSEEKLKIMVETWRFWRIKWFSNSSSSMGLDRVYIFSKGFLNIFNVTYSQIKFICRSIKTHYFVIHIYT